MAYDPKWIRDDAVVKRDGTNDLTGDWDVGDEKRIILDELRIRDTSGLSVTDTTGNVVANMTNDGIFSLANGVGVNEISSDTSLALNSDAVLSTQKAIKTYVTNSIAGISATPESLFYGGDSTAARVTALTNGIEITNGTTPVRIDTFDNSDQGKLTGLKVYDKNEVHSAFIGINYNTGNTAFRSMTPGSITALQGYKDSTSSYVTFVYGLPGASTILRYDNVDKIQTSEDGVEILGGITLNSGEHVNDISNNPLTDSTSALLTASAIGEAITSTSYLHTQSVDSTSWTVTHNLGVKYVNVEVIKSDDTTIIPTSITFNSTTQLTVILPVALQGYVAVSK